MRIYTITNTCTLCALFVFGTHLSSAPALYSEATLSVHVRGLLQFRHAMCTEPERNTFSHRETEELVCDTSGGKEIVAISLFVLLPCVSYCSEALASFLGRGKKSCVRSAGVCHFADINALVHKRSSEGCACRNLCTIANPADQFVVSLT